MAHNGCEEDPSIRGDRNADRAAMLPMPLCIGSSATYPDKPFAVSPSRPRNADTRPRSGKRSRGVGQPVGVDNRTAPAGTSCGIVPFGSEAHAVIGILYSFRQLQPVSSMPSTRSRFQRSSCLARRALSSIRRHGERSRLIALVRSQPGKLSYGSGGIGTTSILSANCSSR